jgi:hypothetical protein
MRQIRFAFLTGQPAVINTHRHNYIGSINEENGKNGLAQLSRLLKGVLKKWPDVKFMATPALGKLIRAEQTVA